MKLQDAHAKPISKQLLTTPLGMPTGIETHHNSRSNRTTSGVHQKANIWRLRRVPNYFSDCQSCEPRRSKFPNLQVPCDLAFPVAPFACLRRLVAFPKWGPCSLAAAHRLGGLGRAAKQKYRPVKI